MGSQIVQALVAQKGRTSTSYQPIEQKGGVSASSAPVQQIATLDSSFDPLEQKEGDSFNAGGSSPDDCFIEQRNLVRETDEGPDTPIEQVIVNTSSQVFEQKKLIRDTAGDEPIEQTSSGTEMFTTVNQYDFIELIFPPCGSIKNPITTDILWRIKDFGFEFDVETITFQVGEAFVHDTANFTITPIVNGLQLDYDPPEPFPYDTDIPVILTISDTADPPNDFLYRCVWRTVEDSRPPIIELLSPLCNASGVDVLAPVVFSVLDVGEGVDLDSIDFSIEGLPVCSGLSFDPTTTASGNGYTVTWTHSDAPFRYESNVTVSIVAADLSPLRNEAFFVCDFDTESSSLPEFRNFDPAECETWVDNRTGLTFEVYGNIDGVDISTLEVRIDNQLRKVYIRPRLYRSE